jgi:cyclopropane fatty-acyl-phospholipid synthase-like methyltransferase
MEPGSGSAFLEFARLDDGWHILDVGSGTGSLALEVAEQEAKVPDYRNRPLA